MQGDEELMIPSESINDEIHEEEEEDDEQLIDLEIGTHQTHQEADDQRNYGGDKEDDDEQLFNLEITQENHHIMISPQSAINTPSTLTNQGKRSHTLQELMDLDDEKLPVTALGLVQGKIEVLERKGLELKIERLTKEKSLPQKLQEESEQQGNVSSSPKGNFGIGCINFTRPFKEKAMMNEKKQSRI